MHNDNMHNDSIDTMTLFDEDGYFWHLTLRWHKEVDPHDWRDWLLCGDCEVDM